MIISKIKTCLKRLMGIIDAMTYAAIVEMSNSASLSARVAACAAEQGNSQARQWAGANLISVVADPAFGWPAAWDFAKGTATINNNPDIGARDDVISDVMILAAVQARKASQGAGNQGWPA